MAAPLLAVKALNAHYGASHVLFDVGLDVGAGETVALVGPNGAGKTTTLASVMGLGGIARSGSIRVDGAETLGMGPHEVARLGVALVPEGRRVFGSLTVEENLAVARRLRRPRRRWRSWPRKREDGLVVAADPAAGGAVWSAERVFATFPLLAQVRRSKAAWLSGGEQQALAIARALVAGPRLLLLDEPSEGLAPRLVEQLTEQLAALGDAGVAMLLAEQHMGVVDALAGRVYRIERGVVRGGDAVRRTEA